MSHWLQVRKENLTFNVTSHACKLIINSFNDSSSLANLLTELTNKLIFNIFNTCVIFCIVIKTLYLF